MENKPITGFRRVQTTWGETLQELAARELGDAALWTTIAAYNNLVAPYLSGDQPTARVARWGDTLIIPDAHTDIEVGSLSAEDVFKTDLALVDGKLDVALTNFATVTGRDNLKQAIATRITTAKGELIFHTDYGCDIAKLKGQGNDAVNALLGAKYVETAMLADDRIARVTQVTVSPSGDAMPVDAQVMTATGHPLNLTVNA